MEAENIEARPIWKPMHLQPVFCLEPNINARRLKGDRRNEAKARALGGGVAEDLFKHGLCLPSGTAMTDEDIQRVVSVVLKCRKI